MSSATWQFINTVLAGAILLIVAGLARWITGKADKSDLAEMKLLLDSKADKVELNRVESESKASVARTDVKLDAGLLIIGLAITRPELAEKITAMTGRSDDRMARVMADIVQLFADSKANAKATAETDKRLDDLPGRVRTLEDREGRKG